MTEYQPAPAVETIAKALISKHHRHLSGQRIECVFRDKASKSKGREVWGTARVITGLNAFLADDERFAVLEIAADVWDRIDASQRQALVDHELCHLMVDDEGVIGTVGHDVEEFAAVIRRHGLWMTDIEEFAGVVQLTFDGAA